MQNVLLGFQLQFSYLLSDTMKDPKVITGHLVIVSLVCVQIADLESEDGKNDTMVDVVFKKALKEFRINIFNSYSTALAVSARLLTSLEQMGIRILQPL